ncbi:MAG: hypothetical protein OEU32_09430 [Acidimicrobiia bacterium]|nr:hypothetical protein [Acidimicrobiia bacterium]
MTTVLAIAGITLGVWFSPIHGQPNEDRVQQIDVAVVDDEGDDVPGAVVTVERRDSGRWVSGGRGGSTDASGLETVDMGTTTGVYRIVLTVPNGYTDVRDDADGNHPGRNFECSGMVRRCVVYEVDANQNVRLQSAAGRSTGMSVTFHLRDTVPEPRVHLTQYDVTSGTGVLLPGGTITVTPTEIIKVNGQDVIRRGREVRYTTRTAGRTLFLNAGTYEIGWEPPAGFVKVSPRWKRTVTVPIRGSVSHSFSARSGAIQGEDSSQQLDENPDEIVPGGQQGQRGTSPGLPEQRSEPESPTTPEAPPAEQSGGTLAPAPSNDNTDEELPTEGNETEQPPTGEDVTTQEPSTGYIPVDETPNDTPVNDQPDENTNVDYGTPTGPPNDDSPSDEMVDLPEDWEVWCEDPESPPACEGALPTSELDIELDPTTGF